MKGWIIISIILIIIILRYNYLDVTKISEKLEIRIHAFVIYYEILMR